MLYGASRLFQSEFVVINNGHIIPGLSQIAFHTLPVYIIFVALICCSGFALKYKHPGISPRSLEDSKKNRAISLFSQE